MMTTIIAIIIIAIIAVFAIRGVVKHARGESSCCGTGGTVKAKEKKLDGPVLGVKTVHIEGMTCVNCKNNVERAVNDIDGAACKVDLKNNIAKISYDRDIDVNLVKQAIEKMHYNVVSIE